MDRTVHSRTDSGGDCRGMQMNAMDRTNQGQSVRRVEFSLARTRSSRFCWLAWPGLRGLEAENDALDRVFTRARSCTPEKVLRWSDLGLDPNRDPLAGYSNIGIVSRTTLWYWWKPQLTNCFSIRNNRSWTSLHCCLWALRSLVFTFSRSLSLFVNVSVNLYDSVARVSLVSALHSSHQ